MITRYTLFLLLLLCCSPAVRGQQQKKLLPHTDTTIYMLTYGLPLRASYDRVLHFVAAKYGFQYLSVGGCVVDEETRCCVSRLNEITTSYLKLINGEDWEQRFEQDLAFYERMQDSAVALSMRMPYIIRKQKEQEKLGFALVFEPRFLDGLKACAVDVFGWDNKQGTMCFYKLEVNTATKKVKVLSNKPAPCYYCPPLNAI